MSETQARVETSGQATAPIRVSAEELGRVTRAVLERAGLLPEHSAIVAEALVEAELRGQGSHGVSRLLGIYVQRLKCGAINPRPDVHVVARRGATAIVDGDNGPGQVAGRYAMGLALDLAAEHGIGLVVVRHSNHYGAAAFYLRAALERGFMGWTTTNAPPNMPPWGGRKPFLGTNPLAIAIPGGQHGPILLDMATSVVAKGKIQLMAKEGHTTIPEGWALDAEGHPTQDLKAAIEGMMLPIGGPKGYGLALVVEVLSALLSGADYGPHLGNMYTNFDRGQNVGHSFGAVDISAFLPLEAFCARLDEMITEMKAVPLAPGSSEILLPGEIESRCEARYRAEGIPVDAAVLHEISRIAREHGVEPPATL